MIIIVAGFNVFKVIFWLISCTIWKDSIFWNSKNMWYVSCNHAIAVIGLAFIKDFVYRYVGCSLKDGCRFIKLSLLNHDFISNMWGDILCIESLVMIFYRVKFGWWNIFLKSLLILSMFSFSSIFGIVNCTFRLNIKSESGILVVVWG